MENNERNQWKGIERKAERRVGKVKERVLFIERSKMEKNERNQWKRIERKAERRVGKVGTGSIHCAQ
jgi:hypothetical protein